MQSSVKNLKDKHFISHQGLCKFGFNSLLPVWQDDTPRKHSGPVLKVAETEKGPGNGNNFLTNRAFLSVYAATKTR